MCCVGSRTHALFAYTTRTQKSNVRWHPQLALPILMRSLCKGDGRNALCIVMEFAAGGDLASYIKKRFDVYALVTLTRILTRIGLASPTPFRPRLPTEAVLLPWIRQLASGLEYLHQHKVYSLLKTCIHLRCMP